MDNSMNEEKTLEDIFNEAASDTKYIHITFQQGVVVYGIALDEGRIVGATGNVIAYNDAERARFTDEYEERKLQGADFTLDDFPEETRRKWERDYVINTLTDVLVGGPISSYSLYSIDAPTEGVVLTEPMTVQDALRIATDEANRRVDEFSRIGLGGVSLDSVFFEIADDTNIRDFAAESDVNKLIILASQANANLWTGIMRSGGFLTSEIYACIADDVLSGQLILVDREGNRLTEEHKPENAVQPAVEAPQYDVSAPVADGNASTVDRIFVQTGEQPTYGNADAGNDADIVEDEASAPVEQPVSETPVAVDEVNEKPVDADEVEDGETATEPASYADETKPENTEDDAAPASEPAPETNGFHIPDMTVPTLSTSEFHAVNANHEDEGDADNADTVDAEPHDDASGFEDDAHEDEATVDEEADTTAEGEPVTDEQEPVAEPAVDADETPETHDVPEEAHAGIADNADAPKPYADEQVVALFTTGLDDLDAELGSIPDRRSLLERSISEQNARIDDIHDVERQIGDLKTQVSRLEGMRDSMKDEADSFAADIADAKAELDRLDAHEAELGKRSEWLHRAQEVLHQAGLL